MIKAVFFDLGNVLMPVDGYRLARKLAGYTPLSPNKILGVLRKELIIRGFEMGKVGPREWYKKICDGCRLKDLSYPNFVRFFNDIFTLDIQVAGLLRRLKNQYKLGLISNTNQLHTSHLMRKYKFFRDFDRMWLSHQIGIRKPDRRIYELALSHFSVPAEQSVFIDDVEKNVQGATRVGMKGIHFKGFKPLTRKLRKLGVQI